MTLVLGVDIGGTNSRAVLCRDGEVMAQARAGSASLTAAGRPAATRALADLIGQLDLPAHGRLDATCVGTAGDHAATELHTAVLGPHTRRLMVVSDLRLILPASGVDDGLAVVGGTGSRAIGVLAGREVYAGGYGWLLGDEGSGWWVVREGLRVVLARLDAGQPPGELGALLLAHASLTDPGELLWSVYARADPGFWAGAAAAVLACDDPAAPAILAASADALVALIEQAGDALDGQAALSASLPVVLAGGLLVGHRPLTEAVRTRLADAGHPDVRVLDAAPVLGALRLARQLAGAPVTAGCRPSPSPSN